MRIHRLHLTLLAAALLALAALAAFPGPQDARGPKAKVRPAGDVLGFSGHLGYAPSPASLDLASLTAPGFRPE